MTNTAVSENIIIQDVSENSMTLDVNGEVRTIQNQLSELKEILKSQNISNVTYENKIYNIEHINEANFGVVTSKKVFNGVLTKELMLLLKDHEIPHEFFDNLPTEDKENWESKRQFLKDAQGILEDSFVWVIGWELRRLF
jgi:DNA-directed RNA polymerase subunit L